MNRGWQRGSTVAGIGVAALLLGGAWQVGRAAQGGADGGDPARESSFDEPVEQPSVGELELRCELAITDGPLPASIDVIAWETWSKDGRIRRRSSLDRVRVQPAVDGSLVSLTVSLIHRASGADLPDGIELEARASVQPAGACRVERPFPVDGSVLDFGELRLERPALLVEGLVVDRGGGPVEDARVTVRHWHPLSHSWMAVHGSPDGRTAADGTFSYFVDPLQLRGADAAPMVEVESPDGQVGAASIRAAGEELILELGTPLDFELRVPQLTGIRSRLEVFAMPQAAVRTLSWRLVPWRVERGIDRLAFEGRIPFEGDVAFAIGGPDWVGEPAPLRVVPRPDGDGRQVVLELEGGLSSAVVDLIESPGGGSLPFEILAGRQREARRMAGPRRVYFGGETIQATVVAADRRGLDVELTSGSTVTVEQPSDW
ncbi:hypothetical protein [Engelhardtia mirabilis]|uniref:Uncharacterized protein n=1 Tax=Engelhardtia mirabilis TaxID=2528011 RepID=A0A518BHK4_9BACT|nr:hypothetical protein Pla133_15320 [Planctomycetes bacterium Pla133]QDV00784.1 hypothetical protein Pla86_15310 [Planctomycetes bacterium Pla86]